MVQTLQATDVTLNDLIEKFDIQLVQDDRFFTEWQADFPDLTNEEKQFLDRIKAGYFNLINYPPLLEKSIQFAVVAPILFLAGFYLPPYQIKTEKSIEIAVEDEDTIIRGQIDILLLKERVWLLVIESKRAAFSIEAGLAQLLTYLLSNPNSTKPSYGLITSGGSFIFVKLVQGKVPQYATSNEFNIRNRGNQLYDVFKILKHISQL
ncbi:restriction endonuclease subunit R [Microcoleus sp. FACHB-1515]|uniref:restriction endonuclease subunit R n=1 Tax=Cyanophyceae TaxID=3028117 RepID=UPI00168801B7|nr:restriction endonuclease subunit R [Microcoleus sp. FACHB-1515]MBD2090453.1 restriction endonuclease subunit R [Microcoleus sp. FACHB-1515]